MHKRALYSELAEYYDHIYWWKDYRLEVDFLQKVLVKHKVFGGRILEVACGTGSHTKLLAARGYDVTGLDLSEDVLRVAKRKLRGRAKLVKGDMRNLDMSIKGEFDSVVCLFSAISYNVGVPEFKRTLKGFHQHLRKGGVAIFDTHFTKRDFRDGYRSEDIFDDGKVIGARLSLSTRKANVGRISFTYLIKDGRRVIVLRNDIHQLGLLDPEEFIGLMKEVGFRKAEVYQDWTVPKRGERTPGRENIFVGVK